MHSKWKDAFSRASIAVFMTATSLYAIPRGPCDVPPPPVCCEEPKPGPFAFAYPYDVDLNCPRDFYFHVDGLMMQAKQQGMNFAIIDENGTSDPLIRGQLEGFSSRNHDWKYQPGMRVGGGFYLNHDAWCVDFNWTWLNITDYKHANVSTGGGTLIPLWLTGVNMSGSNIFGPRASANWQADYNTIDGRLCKPYYVSRYLVLSPHIGLRGVWIDQHFSVDYGATPGTPTSRTIHHGDNDFWGIGSRVGFDSEWILGKGWCLFGNFAASMIYGKFEVEQNMNYGVGVAGASVAGLPTAGDGFNVENNFYQNVPNYEILLGVGWGSYFSKQRYRVGLKAAYEFHQWADQLNMVKFFSGTGAYASDFVSRGDLSLNGFSLRLQLDM
jgi:hypothetical protein